MPALHPDDDARVTGYTFRVHRPYFAALARERAVDALGGALVAGAAPGASRLHLARLRAILSGVGR